MHVIANNYSVERNPQYFDKKLWETLRNRKNLMRPTPTPQKFLILLGDEWITSPVTPMYFKAS